MSPDDLLTQEAEIFDVRGETCPFPALHSQKKLKKMPVGHVVEIWIDHPPAAEETIPGICASNDWLYHSEKIGDYWKIRVQKTR